MTVRRLFDCIDTNCWVYLFDIESNRLWFGVLLEYYNEQYNNKALKRLLNREIKDFNVTSVGVKIWVK